MEHHKTAWKSVQNRRVVSCVTCILPSPSWPCWCTNEALRGHVPRVVVYSRRLAHRTSTPTQKHRRNTTYLARGGKGRDPALTHPAAQRREHLAFDHLANVVSIYNLPICSHSGRVAYCAENGSLCLPPDVLLSLAALHRCNRRRQPPPTR